MRARRLSGRPDVGRNGTQRNGPERDGPQRFPSGTTRGRDSGGALRVAFADGVR